MILVDDFVLADFSDAESWRSAKWSIDGFMKTRRRKNYLIIHLFCSLPIGCGLSLREQDTVYDDVVILVRSRTLSLLWARESDSLPIKSIEVLFSLNIKNIGLLWNSIPEVQKKVTRKKSYENGQLRSASHRYLKYCTFTDLRRNINDCDPTRKSEKNKKSPPP